jgi:hypothetical protein
MRPLAYEWAFDITGQFYHIYTDCMFAASLIFFLSSLSKQLTQTDGALDVHVQTSAIEFRQD